jgi:uncharacterized protein YndB with AHSA1/START domain
MRSRVPSESTFGRAAAIRVRRRFALPAERVFDAWLDPGVAGRWLFATASRPMTHVRIDARVPGSFHFAERRNGARVEHSGEYVEIVPPRRLTFTLALEGRPQVATRVTVEIASRKAGCALTLTHENLPLDRAEHFEARWTGILYGLGVTLEPASDIVGRES